MLGATQHFGSWGAESIKSKGRHFLVWKTSHVSCKYRDREGPDKDDSDDPGGIQDRIQSVKGLRESWEKGADTHREEWRRLGFGWGLLGHFQQNMNSLLPLSFRVSKEKFFFIFFLFF